MFPFSPDRGRRAARKSFGHVGAAERIPLESTLYKEGRAFFLLFPFDYAQDLAFDCDQNSVGGGHGREVLFRRRAPRVPVVGCHACGVCKRCPSRRPRPDDIGTNTAATAPGTMPSPFDCAQGCAFDCAQDFTATGGNYFLIAFHCFTDFSFFAGPATRAGS